MAEKIKLKETYFLSKDIVLKTEKNGAEFSISTGAPLGYMGKKKSGKEVNLLFHVQGGFMNISIPENQLQEYIHDAVAEQVRTAK